MTLAPAPSLLLFHASPAGDPQVHVLYRQDSALVRQPGIVRVFGLAEAAISEHLKSIIETGELMYEATVSILESVRQQRARAVTRRVEPYNLDRLIAVDYRFKRDHATQFHIWATKAFEYLVALVPERAR